MAYNVKTESFEGPFDLLLYLVSRKKVDIGSISISQIADQYLDEVARMERLDLDVASDFLLVAATLLEIKANALIPRAHDELEEEVADLTPAEARDVLIARLVRYKQYKTAAAALEVRAVEERRRHARPFGPDERFLGLMPDFLKNVALDDLGSLAARALGRREIMLLESEHIAAKPIPIDVYVKSISERLHAEGPLTFSRLVKGARRPDVVVVTFLALLELFKRREVDLVQAEPFGDIEVSLMPSAPTPTPASDR